jgi:hypothetical protein
VVLVILELPSNPTQRHTAQVQTIVQVARSGAALSHAPKIWTSVDPVGVLTFCTYTGAHGGYGGVITGV